MQCLMSEVVPDIFEDEEESYLGKHCAPGGEGDLVGC